MLLSFLPLKQSSRIPEFLLYTWRVVRQLKPARGLIGYSLRAKFLHKSFWTLSVWENEEALRAFVRAVPHREIMTALAPHMGRTSFKQWTIKGTELPPDWNDALRRGKEGTAAPIDSARA